MKKTCEKPGFARSIRMNQGAATASRTTGAGESDQLPQPLPLADDPHPEQEDEPGEHDPDESLREHGEPAAESERGERPHRVLAALTALEERPHRDERERHREGEHAVGHVVAAEHEGQRRREQDERRPEPQLAAERPAR